MSKLRIRGGNKLQGTIKISGAKNAALPLLVAGLLTNEPYTLTNVPDLADIKTLSLLLEGHGAELKHDKDTKELRIHIPKITSTTAEYELVSTMRASVLVLGPLLAREHNARVALPGGCAIGSRPVDMHLTALEKMGATFTQENGYLVGKTEEGGLKGADIHFEIVSVGATENLLMAAALAKGTTTLNNAAMEPEVTDLAHCLISMGAEISGVGTSTLRIVGKPMLLGTSHQIVADRIEAGTYAMAAAITDGEVVLENATTSHLQAMVDVLAKVGVKCLDTPDGMLVSRTGPLQATDIRTAPYPGYPTDLQAQFLALMTVADGSCTITETIFENRFMHVPELRRMGADVREHGQYASVKGVGKLAGASVQSTDLRAAAALVIAGLIAEGETFVGNLGHMDRGYEDLEGKLRRVGADIERIQ